MSFNDEKLTAFSLTYVQYNAGDFVGFLCAGLSMAPVFLIVALVTATLSRRDLHIFTGLVGQLLNTIFNVLIKRCIRQPRPSSPAHDNLSTPDAVGFSPHGMPSNHAQFVFFFVGFWVPWILMSRNNKVRSSLNSRNDRSGGGAWCVVIRHVASVIIIFCAIGVVFARVYLHYHTVPQVAVGAVVGLVVGYMWHLLTWSVFVPMLFPLLTNSFIGVGVGISHMHQVSVLKSFVLAATINIFRIYNSINLTYINFFMELFFLKSFVLATIKYLYNHNLTYNFFMDSFFLFLFLQNTGGRYCSV